MKQVLKNLNFKAAIATLYLLLINMLVYAQDQNEGSVTVDKAEVGNWFSENWMYVVGGGILLLIIVFSMGGGSKRTKTTSVRKTSDGVTQTTTSTTTVD
jgi:hypothetical protein